MSKPVTNSDMEDVLSSIRRLVSDNKSSPAPRTAPDLSDRLVLSPQQRVSDMDVLKLRPADAVHVPVAEPPAADASAQGRKGPAALGLDELSEKIAALETEIAKTADQWEPDGTGSDDYAGTQSPGMDWPEAADLDGTGAPQGTDVQTNEPAHEQPSDDQLLDEAALRDLVADIVRSELQGALGERITRNVRKLVRREIHRALAARDLD
ncbi:hypothetical protein [Roseobacter sp. A03A-229]